MTRTMLCALLLLVASVAIGGCRRGAGRAQVAPIPRTLIRFARLAERDLDCSRIETVVYVLPGVVQVRGCGERQEYLTVHRQPPARIERVELVAAGAMVCATGRLTVTSPAPAVRGVVGCDRRARYDLICTSGHCAWTMTAHAGRWAGLTQAIEVPAQFEVTWEPPPDAGPLGPSTPETVDLETIALPPPPDAVIPPP